MTCLRIMTVGLLAAALPAMAAHVGILNGGFEEGNLNNWTSETGASSGNSSASCDAADSWFAGVDGSYGCRFSVYANAYAYTEPPELVAWANAYLNQTFSGDAGQRISLWVRPEIVTQWEGGNAISTMTAQAKLFNAGDQVIWQQSLDMGLAGNPPDWVEVTSVPLSAAGDYKLWIGLSAATTIHEPYGMYDAVNLQAYLNVDLVQLMPEPSALVLLGLGGLGPLARRRK